jgi:hypothetical protein
MPSPTPVPPDRPVGRGAALDSRDRVAGTVRSPRIDPQGPPQVRPHRFDARSRCRPLLHPPDGAHRAPGRGGVGDHGPGAERPRGDHRHRSGGKEAPGGGHRLRRGWPLGAGGQGAGRARRPGRVPARAAVGRGARRPGGRGRRRGAGRCDQKGGDGRGDEGREAPRRRQAEGGRVAGEVRRQLGT